MAETAGSYSGYSDFRHPGGQFVNPPMAGEFAGVLARFVEYRKLWSTIQEARREEHSLVEERQRIAQAPDAIIVDSNHQYLLSPVVASRMAQIDARLAELRAEDTVRLGETSVTLAQVGEAIEIANRTCPKVAPLKLEGDMLKFDVGDGKVVSSQLADLSHSTNQEWLQGNAISFVNEGIGIMLKGSRTEGGGFTGLVMFSKTTGAFSYAHMLVQRPESRTFAGLDFGPKWVAYEWSCRADGAGHSKKID